MVNHSLQVYQIYSQLRGVSVSDAVRAFSQLEVKTPADGDRYFESFGVGHFQNAILQPYERFACYELLLSEIKNADRDKFNAIHKGTPYYFLAWTSFDIGDFERATFYLDAAFAEDVRKSKFLGSNEPIDAAFNNPGGWLMRLSPEQSGPAMRVTERLKSFLEDRLTAFKATNGRGITLNDFTDKFVKRFIKEDIAYRSIVTAIYSFVFEFEDRFRLLNLRSDQGGTLEPLLIHLFKGGLIFESLLKYAGRVNSFKIDEGKKGKGKLPKQIGGFNFCSHFKKKYCDFNKQIDDLPELVKLPINMNNAFVVTYNLRNITGHDLKRDDVFQNPEDYQKLFEQEMTAILYIIFREFIEKWA